MSISSYPKGWIEKKLGELVIVERGSSPRPIKSFLTTSDDGVNWIKIGDTKEGQKIVKSTKEKITVEGAKKSRYVAKGDFILSNSMSFGRPYIMGIDGYIHDGWFVLRLPNEINSDFFYYLLSSSHLKNQFNLLAAGGVVKNISGDLTRKALCPLPPLAEQKQIAAKLDELLAQVDTLKTRLNTIPTILKRFRQSVLASAISGKLTEEWRKINDDKPRSQLERFIREKDEKQKKIEATAHHEEIIDLFPEMWGISNFDELFKFIDYRGKTPKKSANGKRLISAKNIKMGYIQEEPVEYLSNSDYELWMTRGFPKPGDIFFVTEGHTMGCAALNNRDDEFALAQRTITLQPYSNINTKFYLYFMLTEHFQRLVELNATGTAAKGIKASKFRGLPVPFPSVNEQQEIVYRVEQLFIFSDQVEQRLKDAQSKINNLTQSILAKAFRGELTEEWREQNPDLISGKNSAKVLLDMINMERDISIVSKKLTNNSPKKGIKSKMKQKKIICVIEALMAAKTSLSAQKLLEQSGYPLDASIDELESFFLDIREQLKLKLITKKRSGNEDIFSLVK